jgi:hypothetical protein
VATPLAQNNSSIYNIIYTYSSGPWTITPYVQWSHVAKNTSLGFEHDAWTYGGAVLANYAFNSHFSLAGRIEYIGSTGSLSDGAPNLLYGPGSKAMSFTLTPTFQWNRFFVRGEVSYVPLFNAIDGFSFGPNLNKTSQVRGLIETGGYSEVAAPAVRPKHDAVCRRLFKCRAELEASKTLLERLAQHIARRRFG